MTRETTAHYSIPDCQAEVCYLHHVVVGEEHVPEGHVPVDDAQVGQVLHPLGDLVAPVEEPPGLDETLALHHHGHLLAPPAHLRVLLLDIGVH